MGKYIIKRILLLIPILIGATFLVFAIMGISPGDPALTILGADANEEAIARIHEELGLDRPFIVRYGDFLLNLCKGDLGKSYRNELPVTELIMDRLPNTIILASAAIVLAIVIGLPVGIASAIKQYSLFDNVSMVFTLILAAAPGFWMGLVLIIVFSIKLHWFPSSGMGTGFSDLMVSLFLPALTLCGNTAARIARTTRSSMLEVIHQDYIDTARSKGVKESVVIFKHTHDSEMNLIPALATAWTQVDDTTWDFTIRQDVKFHNGETMTVDDVVFSLNRCAELPILVDMVQWFDSVEAVDATTVRIHTAYPYSILPAALTNPPFCVIPQKYYEEVGEDGFAQAPVGTGPYKMLEFQEGQYYTLEAFEDWWGGMAKTKYLTMKVVPEAVQRTIMLETGEADAALELPYNDIAKVIDNDALQIFEVPSMKIFLLWCNCASQGPLGDARVRQAIEYAIDKQAIIDSVCYGYGNPSYNVIPPAAEGYIEAEEHVYDVDKAKALLAEAGYADGFSISLIVNTNQAYNEICQVIQNMLTEVNINLEIITQDDNTTQDSLNAGGDYDMYFAFWQNMIGNAEFTMSSRLSTEPKNFSRYSPENLRELLDKIRQTTDAQKSAELWKELFDTYNQDTPIITLYAERKMIGASANLSGIKLSQVGAHQFEEAVLVKSK